MYVTCVFLSVLGFGDKEKSDLVNASVGLWSGWLRRQVVALSRCSLLLLQRTETCSGGVAVVCGRCGEDLWRWCRNLLERRLGRVVAQLRDEDRRSGSVHALRVVHAVQGLLAELERRLRVSESWCAGLSVLQRRLLVLVRNGDLLAVKCWCGGALAAVDLLQHAAGSLRRVTLTLAFGAVKVTRCGRDHLLLDWSRKSLLTRGRAVLTG